MAEGPISLIFIYPKLLSKFYTMNLLHTTVPQYLHNLREVPTLITLRRKESRQLLDNPMNSKYCHTVHPLRILQLFLLRYAQESCFSSCCQFLLSTSHRKPYPEYVNHRAAPPARLQHHSTWYRCQIWLRNDAFGGKNWQEAPRSIAAN